MKGDRFWRNWEQRQALKRAEQARRVADSIEVRRALMAGVHSGELTLAEAQKELRRIKRAAKKNGMVTRGQAYRGH